jgi:RNA-binding protein
VIAEASRALHDHELVKVRVTGMEREARDEALDSLASGTGSEIVGRIGHTAVLYRRNTERTRIVLPS